MNGIRGSRRAGQPRRGGHVRVLGVLIAAGLSLPAAAPAMASAARGTPADARGPAGTAHAAAASQFASYPLPPLPGNAAYGNIAVSQTGVWVFADTYSDSAPGSIVELSLATGRRIRTLRERTPGQSPWVVGAYGNHLWTITVPAGGFPALAEVTAGGAFTHSVDLAYVETTFGPVSGDAAPAGSHLWAAAGPALGVPTGLVEVSASSGARVRFLRWPRALRGFPPEGMAVSGGVIWMTDGFCQVARVTISSDHASIFSLPPADCQGGSTPAQITATGRYVWVEAWTLGDYASIAELNARNGHLVRVISGARYGWEYPSFLAVGADLWVTSESGGFGGNGSVTELSASTGRLVHFFSGRQYHFDEPWALAAGGSHVWILNQDSVTKL